MILLTQLMPASWIGIQLPRKLEGNSFILIFLDYEPISICCLILHAGLGNFFFFPNFHCFFFFRLFHYAIYLSCAGVGGYGLVSCHSHHILPLEVYIFMEEWAPEKPC